MPLQFEGEQGVRLHTPGFGDGRSQLGAKLGWVVGMGGLSWGQLLVQHLPILMMVVLEATTCCVM